MKAVVIGIITEGMIRATIEDIVKDIEMDGTMMTFGVRGMPNAGGVLILVGGVIIMGIIALGVLHLTGLGVDIMGPTAGDIMILSILHGIDIMGSTDMDLDTITHMAATGGIHPIRPMFM